MSNGDSIYVFLNDSGLIGSALMFLIFRLRQQKSPSSVAKTGFADCALPVCDSCV